MKKPRHRPAPVSFTAEQVPDEETRSIMQDGLDAMTQSITELLEFCVAQRMSQFLLVMKEGFDKDKKPKVDKERTQAAFESFGFMGLTSPPEMSTHYNKVHDFLKELLPKTTE